MDAGASRSKAKGKVAKGHKVEGGDSHNSSQDKSHKKEVGKGRGRYTGGAERTSAVREETEKREMLTLDSRL